MTESVEGSRREREGPIMDELDEAAVLKLASEKRSMPVNPYDISTQTSEFLAWHDGFCAGLQFDQGRQIEAVTRVIKRSIDERTRA